MEHVWSIQPSNLGPHRVPFWVPDSAMKSLEWKKKTALRLQLLTDKGVWFANRRWVLMMWPTNMVVPRANGQQFGFHPPAKWGVHTHNRDDLGKFNKENVVFNHTWWIDRPETHEFMQFLQKKSGSTFIATGSYLDDHQSTVFGTTLGVKQCDSQEGM